MNMALRFFNFMSVTSPNEALTEYEKHIVGEASMYAPGFHPEFTNVKEEGLVLSFCDESILVLARRNVSNEVLCAPITKQTDIEVIQDLHRRLIKHQENSNE